MKINLFLNNYFTQYNKNFMRPKVNFPISLLEKLSNKHFIILRGEPTLYKEFQEVLTYLNRNDFQYLITTDAENPIQLITYKGPIQYVSFNYDGLLNNSLRGNRLYLQKNILKICDFLTSKKSLMRLNYTISPFNRETFYADIGILNYIKTKYPRMKRPYFSIYQQGPYFVQEQFIWTPIDVGMIDKLNKASLLTDRSLRQLVAYHDRATYKCIAPENELNITPDGKVHLCLSYKFNDIIGNLNTQTLQEIINDSKDERDGCGDCQHKEKCFLANHFKDNINGQTR